MRCTDLELQSKELKERLAKLQVNAEKQAYNELVKDVVKHEEDREYFSSYKNSLGFGKHYAMRLTRLNSSKSGSDLDHRA